MPKRDFLAVTDLSKAEILELFRVARELKSGEKVVKPLVGKTQAMIFATSSTRTRVSFESGMYQLGGHALFLSSGDLQLGRGEPIKDTARVMSRYVDGIMIRTYAHSDVEELAEHATVPVINGLTDLLHPCQVLADMFTIEEALGSLVRAFDRSDSTRLRPYGPHSLYRRRCLPRLKDLRHDSGDARTVSHTRRTEDADAGRLRPYHD